MYKFSLAILLLCVCSCGTRAPQSDFSNLVAPQPQKRPLVSTQKRVVSPVIHPFDTSKQRPLIGLDTVPGIGIVSPVYKTKAKPVYPERARKAEIEGTVILQATIDANGSVTDIVPLTHLGFGLEAAIQALKATTFYPGTKAGKPMTLKGVQILLYRFYGASGMFELGSRRWITESELNNAGFNILRRENRNGEFTQINMKCYRLFRPSAL